MAKENVVKTVFLADDTSMKASLKDLKAGSELTFGSMGAKLQGFAAKVPGAGALMERFGISGSTAGLAVAGGIGLAAEKVVSFVADAVSGFEHAAQSVLHFKEITGTTADEASRFVAVGEEFGIAAEDLSGAIGKLNKNVELSPHKLEALGVAIAHTKDGAVDVKQTFLNVVHAYNSTDDAGKKAAIGADAFGKTWQGLAKVLDAGADKVKQSFGEVAQSKLFNDKDLKRAEDYRLALFHLHEETEGLKRAIGEALVPALITVIGDFDSAYKSADRLLGPVGGLRGAFEDLGRVVEDSINPVATAKNIWESFAGSGGTINDATMSMAELAKAAGGVAQEHLVVSDRVSSMRPIMEALSLSYRKQAEEIDKATAASQGYYFATSALEGGELSLERATNNVKDAVISYTEATKEHVDKTHTAVDVTKDQRDALLGAKEAILGAADAAGKYAGDQATLAGATDSTSASQAAARLSLIGVMQTLDPANPLRGWLKDYIDTLYKIPADVVTSVHLLGAAEMAGRQQSRTKAVALAEGGIVPARPGGTLAVLAERGKAEAVIPLDRLAKTGGGGGVHVTINTVLGNPQQIMAVLAPFMRSYQRALQ